MEEKEETRTKVTSVTGAKTSTHRPASAARKQVKRSTYLPYPTPPDSALLPIHLLFLHSERTIRKNKQESGWGILSDHDALQANVSCASQWRGVAG